MEKILENVRKEIKEIEEQGINANNLEILYKLTDIEKDIYEIKEKEHLYGKEDMEEEVEEMMCALYELVETMMAFARTPKEKEAMRKHIQKIKGI